MNPGTPTGSPPERGSPSVAAFLSFLWPGLGQWYSRRPRAALAFALPVLAVLLVLAVQLAGGLGQLASLLLTPSSTFAILVGIVGLGVWREIAVIDAASRTGPRGAWRRGRSLVVLVLVTAIIGATHVWAGSVAWAAYDASNRIFVRAEASAPVGASSSATPSAPGQTPDPEDDYVAAPFATPPTSTERINVLLTGIDSAENRDHALTDTLMVASIDPVTHDVALVSFPRDISDFPMVDGRKFGGKINGFMTYVTNHPKEFKDKPLVELAKELSLLIGVPIQYYAAVDLAGFRKLIDTAGGVTVTVAEPLNDPLYDWLDGRQGFKLSAGTHTLDGKYALAYVRSRQGIGDSDFGRARRQQQVLLALARKLTTPEMLPRLSQLIEVAGDTIRTNFPSDRVGEMLALAQGIDGAKVTKVVLGPPYSYHPPNDQTGGIYVLRLHMDKLAAVSKKIFGNESRYAKP